MTPADLLRAARDFESLGHPAEADRLRWAAARAVSGSVLSEPAPSGDLGSESEPSCLLGAALRDAEAVGDLDTVYALLGALAGLPRPSRRAA